MKRPRQVPAKLDRRPTPIARLDAVRGGALGVFLKLDGIEGESVDSHHGLIEGWDNVKNTTYAG